MPPPSQPRERRRRKDARPAEIVAAAAEVFIDAGFAAAKLDEVARRAGVAKGTLYLYFPTKEELFRAVVRGAAAPMTTPQSPPALPLALLVPALLARAADTAQGSHLPAMARMVIAESRAFPDLARIWHDDVVAPLIGMLAGAIAAAQARGEARGGDPRLHAFSIAGALLAGLLYGEVFGPVGAQGPNLMMLAGQHADTILRGLLVGQSTEEEPSHAER